MIESQRNLGNLVLVKIAETDFFPFLKSETDTYFKKKL